MTYHVNHVLLRIIIVESEIGEFIHPSVWGRFK
jgi:hypothetical protein